MSMNLDRLIADLKAINPSERVLCWSGWDREFPPKYTDFREYLFRADELLAALTGQAPPPPSTIRVKTTAALNVRKAPIDGEKVTTLAPDTVIEVHEIEAVNGWYKISAGTYTGYFVSAQYVVKV